MLKNTASQKWRVFAFDRTDSTPKTGDAANITAKISIDGGALGATNDVNPTELEDGFYEFDLTQAETNGDDLFLSPESSTADIQVIGVPGSIATQPAALTDWQDGGRLDLILDIIAADVANIDGAAMRGTDSAATAAALATHDGKLDTVDTNIDTLLTRITSTLFSGITSLAEWLGAMAGKQASDATAQTEMRATGAGSGSYDATTDSQEALRDHVGDGTSLTEAGGTGNHLTAVPWNAAWEAEVQGDVTASLNAYDPPTKIWAHVIENSLTAEQIVRGVGSALMGKASGMGTATGIFRDLADSKARITATTDANGNRAAVTLDLT